MDNEHKVCMDCKSKLPLSFFHKRTDAKDGLAPRCKQCAIAKVQQWQRDNKDKVNAKNRTWKAAHPERVRATAKRYRRTLSAVQREHKNRRDALRANYGMTIAEYDALLFSQNEVCAICKKPSPNFRRLSVDHNHETGAIRGLLCALCNVAIAAVERDPNWAKRAEFYLWAHSQRKVNTMATSTGKDMLYGADPQGEALEVAAAGLRNNCVLDINGGASDKSSAEKLSTDTADSRQDTEGKQDTENRGT